MKSTGIVRRMDNLGRIVVPIELRRTLEIAEKEPIEIYMDNDRIVLKKYEPACIFCGETEGIINFKDRSVCRKCLVTIQEFV